MNEGREKGMRTEPKNPPPRPDQPPAPSPQANRLRFRAWNNVLKQMILPDLDHAISFSGVHASGWVDGHMAIDEPAMPEDFIIMQSTGLTDKNGKEIFEGDLLRWEYSDGSGGGVVQVKRCDSGSWYREFVSGNDTSDYYASDAFIIHMARENPYVTHAHQTCEVIGNIYENKEG